MNKVLSSLSPALGSCLFVAFLCLGAGTVRAQDRLYWCKHDNGAEYAQKDPCPSGTEVRSSAAVNGVSEGQEVQSAAPAPAVEAPKAAPPVDKETTLKQGQMAWLRYLGWAVAFGIIAKLFKKSFFLGFFLGFILRIILVAADLVEF